MVPRGGRSKRRCEMKLSVCRVVIIVNRKVDNAAWAIFHADSISNVAGCTYELSPCSLRDYHYRIGRKIRYACDVLFESHDVTSTIGPACVRMLRARTHAGKRFFDNVKLLLLAIVHD